MKRLILLGAIITASLQGAGITILDGIYDSSINPARRIFRVYFDSSHSITDSTMPIVVFIHGGAWTAGAYGTALGQYGAFAPGICPDTLTVLCALAGRGYAVYSIEYTLAEHGPQTQWPAQWQDCDCFLRFLADQAGVSLPGDRSHIVMFGHSSGAHLAAMVTMAPHDAFPVNCSHTSLSYRIDGVIAASFPDDLVALYNASIASQDKSAAGAIVGLLNCVPASPDEQCIAEAKNASPTHYVAEGQPPVMVLSGLGDTIIPYQTQGLLRAAYNALNPPVFSRWIIFPENYLHYLDLFYYIPCSASPVPEPSPCGTDGTAAKDIGAFLQGLPAVP